MWHLNTKSRKPPTQQQRTFESAFGYFYSEEKSSIVKSYESSILKQPKTHCKKVCCKTIYQEPLTTQDYNFISEDLLDLNSAPFSEFLPEISFASHNSIPNQKLIHYKKHLCLCRITFIKNQHCFLKNVFPTYHPEFGYLTSVVNQMCIKKKCDNRKSQTPNTSSVPMDCRNIRQIVLWNQSQIEKFFSRQVTSLNLIQAKHLGRISLCINHFSPEDQLFFWKNGFMREDADLSQKLQINFISKVSLYENNLLPSFESITENAGQPFPLNQMPFPFVLGGEKEKNTESSVTETEENGKEEKVTESFVTETKDNGEEEKVTESSVTETEETKQNGESSESDSSQPADLACDPELDISFPNAELFLSDNIDSLIDENFQIESPSITEFTWNQFTSVANSYKSGNYYYCNFKMVAYLRWNKESGKIDSFFLDSKNKDKLINDEIKLFNNFCSDKKGSLLLQAVLKLEQGIWKN